MLSAGDTSRQRVIEIAMFLPHVQPIQLLLKVCNHLENKTVHQSLTQMTWQLLTWV